MPVIHLPPNVFHLKPGHVVWEGLKACTVYFARPSTASFNKKFIGFYVIFPLVIRVANLEGATKDQQAHK